jgi:hypothetical protein
MFIVEDIRHAPMAPLATAETPEEAHARADALGLGEHAFIRPVAGTLAQTLKRCEDADRQIDLFESRARTAEAAKKEAEEAVVRADRRATNEVKTAQRSRDEAITRANALADANAELRKNMDVHNTVERLHGEIALLRAGVSPAPAATEAA